MLLTCEVCKKQFTYDDTKGYSRDPAICSAFCDGKQVGLREERERCRREEVKPLMDAIDRWREACKSIRPEVQSRAEHGIEMAYAAVRAAQEKG